MLPLVEYAEGICIAIEEISVRISLKEYMGHHCFDIRVFCDPNHDEGQGRIPTKKGVTMAVTKLPDLVAALQQAVSEARAAGLLPNRGEAD